MASAAGRFSCLPRNARIFDLWLACWTDAEIGEEVGLERSSVTKITDGFVNIGNLSKIHKSAADHATDFEPPIYPPTRARGRMPCDTIYTHKEVQCVAIAGQRRK